MRIDYSEREQELFDGLGFSYLVELSSIGPMQLYKIAVDEAFIYDLGGPLVEALRRAYKGLMLGGVYRKSKELENLLIVG